MSFPNLPLGPLEILTCDSCGARVSGGFYATALTGLRVYARVLCADCVTYLVEHRTFELAIAPEISERQLKLPF